MLVTIKPHSSLQKYFNGDILIADLHRYSDITEYLASMHPKFTQYSKELLQDQIDEGFVFLDESLQEITPDSMAIRSCKDGDTIHIVPAIIGGSGKRGGILAILAVAAFFVFLPAIAAVAPAGSALATAGAGVGGATGLQASAAILKGMPMLNNLVTQVALSALSRIFSPPKQNEQTRQNDMFGSLTNSTTVGTPVALHYGQVRVAGQMISGYISSVPHGKNQSVNVAGELYNTSDSDSEQPDLDTLLAGKGLFPTQTI